MALPSHSVEISLLPFKEQLECAKKGGGLACLPVFLQIPDYSRTKEQCTHTKPITTDKEYQGPLSERVLQELNLDGLCKEGVDQVTAFLCDGPKSFRKYGSHVVTKGVRRICWNSAPTNHVTTKSAQSNGEYRGKSVCTDRHKGVSLSGSIRVIYYCNRLGRNALRYVTVT